MWNATSGWKSLGINSLARPPKLAQWFCHGASAFKLATEAIEDATLRGRLCAPLSKQLPAQMASLSPGEQLQLLDVQHPELLSVVAGKIPAAVRKCLPLLRCGLRALRTNSSRLKLLLKLQAENLRWYTRLRQGWRMRSWTCHLKLLRLPSSAACSICSAQEGPMI